MTITRTITSYICDETKQIFVEKEHSLSFEGYRQTFEGYYASKFDYGNTTMVLVNTSQYSDNSVMEHSYFCPKIRNPKSW